MKRIELTSVSWSPLKYRTLEPNETAGQPDIKLIQLLDPLMVALHTKNEGTIRITIPAEFISDGRSGGMVADWIVGDGFTPEAYLIAWLVHDWNFLTNSLSFGLTNDILREMLRVTDGGSWWRNSWGYRRLVYRAVSSPLGLHYYEDKRDYQDMQNAHLIGRGSYRWGCGSQIVK